MSDILLTPDDSNFYELIQSCEGKLIEDLHEADFNIAPITSSFLWMEGVIEHIAEVFTKAQLAKAEPIYQAKIEEVKKELCDNCDTPLLREGQILGIRKDERDEIIKSLNSELIRSPSARKAAYRRVIQYLMNKNNIALKEGEK